MLGAWHGKLSNFFQINLEWGFRGITRTFAWVDDKGEVWRGDDSLLFNCFVISLIPLKYWCILYILQFFIIKYLYLPDASLRNWALELLIRLLFQNIQTRDPRVSPINDQFHEISTKLSVRDDFGCLYCMFLFYFDKKVSENTLQNEIEKKKIYAESTYMKCDF